MGDNGTLRSSVGVIIIVEGEGEEPVGCDCCCCSAEVGEEGIHEELGDDVPPSLPLLLLPMALLAVVVSSSFFFVFTTFARARADA